MSNDTESILDLSERGWAMDLEIWRASTKNFPMEWRAMTFTTFIARKETIETRTFFEADGEELRFDFEVSGDTFKELGDWDGIFKAIRFFIDADLAHRRLENA